MELACAALSLWNKLVPKTASELGIGGLLPEAVEPDAGYYLLLCVLLGLVCWSRVWFGVAQWAVLQLMLAGASLVASVDWGLWTAGWWGAAAGIPVPFLSGAWAAGGRGRGGWGAKNNENVGFWDLEVG